MADNFSDLVKEIKSCRDCRSLFGFEPNPVFTGNENAKILQISQAPSQNVHNTSKCFNDASGKKLRGEWYKISDEDFYKVVEFQNNKIFTLSDLDNNYHVKYTYRKINDNQTEMEYFEWMENGDLSNPFTDDIIQKLKSVMESD